VAGHVESTRGCLHLCRHCPIPPVYGGRFVAVPVETVLADVRQQVVAGATHVTFGDPDFLNGPGHARRIARALHAEHPALTFDFTAKIEHLIRHRALLPELVEAGALFAVSAAESLSDTVLAHLDKGHTAADVEIALGLARAAGLDLRPTWVAFTPWTTLGGYRRMLDFIAEHDLVDRVDPVQYGLRLLVPPGSLLATYEPMQPHLGPLRAADFAYAWTHPDPRMDRLAADAMALVSEAAGRGEDVAVTFARVCALAAAADGEASTAVHRQTVTAGHADPERVRPPHLTEPWFC
jgi:hypothetical protein